MKEAIDLARKAKTDEATATRNRITDPAGQKLVEWFILRHSETTANFSRYAAFLAANPEWPSVVLRRRAEARLWQERSDAATVRGFTGEAPISARGKLALARVLLAAGDRETAGRLVREAWRTDELSERVEAEAYELFRDLLTRDDHRARMDKRIGAKDLAGARRAAQRLGSEELAIVKACAAVRGKANKALDALDAVATEARADLGYTLCRIQWMLAQNKIDDAARLMLAAAPETMALQDTDEWWRERRALARKLLDQGKFQTAYQVIRPAAAPANEYYRADFHFMCGWIALRYLNDPATARGHFAHIDDGATNPIVLARANYWRGRAAEALGDKDAMRAGYEAAARYPTAYYGQLARAGLAATRSNCARPRPCSPPPMRRPRTNACAPPTCSTRSASATSCCISPPISAKQSTDVAVLEALGELTGRRNDARAMLQIGKTALARGLALDHYAFPTIGIPQHSPIGPEIERSVIYSVARTESAFDQRDKSPANAVGLPTVGQLHRRGGATRHPRAATHPAHARRPQGRPLLRPRHHRRARSRSNGGGDRTGRRRLRLLRPDRAAELGRGQPTGSAEQYCSDRAARVRCLVERDRPAHHSDRVRRDGDEHRPPRPTGHHARDLGPKRPRVLARAPSRVPPQDGRGVHAERGRAARRQRDPHRDGNSDHAGRAAEVPRARGDDLPRCAVIQAASVLARRSMGRQLAGVRSLPGELSGDRRHLAQPPRGVQRKSADSIERTRS